MMISLVVAATENNIIGKNNQLLWHLPNDMRFFKNTTWGSPIAMGRRTFESIGKKPLAGRRNIVITRKKDLAIPGVTVVHDVPAALRVAEMDDAKEIFIIGGGEIYKETFEMAHRIYMTRVHANLQGDVHFPEIKNENWSLSSSVDHPADSKHAYPYTFEIWDRAGKR